MIGWFTLLEKIGAGGFGTVFMAEQLTPVRRKVPLKVIKPSMDTKQVIARFESERQVLALMDYPNIAKVPDAGATDAGLPYFVMELVQGIPITDYCDRNSLTPRQRLELFVQVCHAGTTRTAGRIGFCVTWPLVVVMIATDLPTSCRDAKRWESLFGIRSSAALPVRAPYASPTGGTGSEAACAGSAVRVRGGCGGGRGRAARGGVTSTTVRTTELFGDVRLGGMRWDSMRRSCDVPRRTLAAPELGVRGYGRPGVSRSASGRRAEGGRRGRHAAKRWPRRALGGCPYIMVA